MKNIIFLITAFVMILGFTSCEDGNFVFDDVLDSTMETSSAMILGLDEETCDCCGDWKIEIEGEDQVFMFKQLPNSNIDLQKAEFPLAVTVQWLLNESMCENHIIIGSMELE